MFGTFHEFIRIKIVGRHNECAHARRIDCNALTYLQHNHTRTMRLNVRLYRSAWLMLWHNVKLL